MSRSKIFGMECIFGLDWKVDQIRPWILDTIEFFRPERCMLASHMPIAKLARSFQDLYCAYLDVVSEFSTSGKRKLAAVRMLFDFLVVRQITPSNPAHSVRGPKYVVKKGTSKRDIHAEPIQDAGWLWAV